MPALNIFEWSAWNRFLAVTLMPNAQRVKVTPGFALNLAETVGPASLLHVNLSRPNRAFPNYIEWLDRHRQLGKPVINGYCASIDKWSVQESCARTGLPCVRASQFGDAAEMMIVKSRANYGGLSEKKLSADLVGDLKPSAWSYQQRVQLFRRDQVPSGIWDDSSLTVERYVSNPTGRFRRAYVAGDYVAVATSRADDVLKVMDHSAGVDLVSDTLGKNLSLDPRDPLSVAYRIAQAMRVDFAAIDLAVDENDINYPIDVNTTPSWGDDHDPRLLRELADAMAILVEKGSLHADAGPSSAAVK